MRVLAQSPQQHDRAEALATELAKVRRAVEQKPAPDRSATGSIKPDEPARVEHKPRGGYGCQHFRTYDPASGTYMAMTDDGIPARKFGRRFGDKSS